MRDARLVEQGISGVGVTKASVNERGVARRWQRVLRGIQENDSSRVGRRGREIEVGGGGGGGKGRCEVGSVTVMGGSDL